MKSLLLSILVLSTAAMAGEFPARYSGKITFLTKTDASGATTVVPSNALGKMGDSCEITILDIKVPLLSATKMKVEVSFVQKKWDMEYHHFDGESHFIGTNYDGAHSLQLHTTSAQKDLEPNTYYYTLKSSSGDEVTASCENFVRK